MPDLTPVDSVFFALWAISEALALIPGIKSNSIFQLIWTTLRRIRGLS